MSPIPSVATSSSLSLLASSIAPDPGSAGQSASMMPQYLLGTGGFLFAVAIFSVVRYFYHGRRAINNARASNTWTSFTSFLSPSRHRASATTPAATVADWPVDLQVGPGPEHVSMVYARFFHPTSWNLVECQPATLSAPAICVEEEAGSDPVADLKPSGANPLLGTDDDGDWVMHEPIRRAHKKLEHPTSHTVTQVPPYDTSSPTNMSFTSLIIGMTARLGGFLSVPGQVEDHPSDSLDCDSDSELDVYSAAYDGIVTDPPTSRVAGTGYFAQHLQDVIEAGGQGLTPTVSFRTGLVDVSEFVETDAVLSDSSMESLEPVNEECTTLDFNTDVGDGSELDLYALAYDGIAETPPSSPSSIPRYGMASMGYFAKSFQDAIPEEEQGSIWTVPFRAGLADVSKFTGTDVVSSGTPLPPLESVENESATSNCGIDICQSCDIVETGSSDAITLGATPNGSQDLIERLFVECLSFVEDHSTFFDVGADNRCDGVQISSSNLDTLGALYKCPDPIWVLHAEVGDPSQDSIPSDFPDGSQSEYNSDEEEKEANIKRFTRPWGPLNPRRNSLASSSFNARSNDGVSDEDPVDPLTLLPESIASPVNLRNLCQGPMWSAELPGIHEEVQDEKTLPILLPNGYELHEFVDNESMASDCCISTHESIGTVEADSRDPNLFRVDRESVEPMDDLSKQLAYDNQIALHCNIGSRDCCDTLHTCSSDADSLGTLHEGLDPVESFLAEYFDLTDDKLTMSEGNISVPNTYDGPDISSSDDDTLHMSDECLDQMEKLLAELRQPNPECASKSEYNDSKKGSEQDSDVFDEGLAFYPLTPPAKPVVSSFYAPDVRKPPGALPVSLGLHEGGQVMSTPSLRSLAAHDGIIWTPVAWTSHSRQQGIAHMRHFTQWVPDMVPNEGQGPVPLASLRTQLVHVSKTEPASPSVPQGQFLHIHESRRSGCDINHHGGHNMVPTGCGDASTPAAASYEGLNHHDIGVNDILRASPSNADTLGALDEGLDLIEMLLAEYIDHSGDNDDATTSECDTGVDGRCDDMQICSSDASALGAQDECLNQTRGLIPELDDLNQDDNSRDLSEDMEVGYSSDDEEERANIKYFAFPLDLRNRRRNSLERWFSSPTTDSDVSGEEPTFLLTPLLEYSAAVVDTPDVFKERASLEVTPGFQEEAPVAPAFSLQLLPALPSKAYVRTQQDRRSLELVFGPRLPLANLPRL